MRAPISGWTVSVERTARAAFVVPFLLVLATMAMPMAAEWEHVSAIGQVGLILLGVIQVGLVTVALLGISRFSTDLVLVLVTCAALFMVLLGQPVDPDRTWWPSSVAHLVQVWVLGFGGRYRWGLGGTAIVAFASIRLAAGIARGEDLLLCFVEVVSGAQLSLMLILGVLAIRRIAALLDAAESERAQTLLVERDERAREARSRAIGRFLHDEVIHSLRAIALPRTRVSAEQARDLAGRTAARLRAGWESDEPAVPGLGVRLATIAGELGLHATVSGQVAGVPGDVEQAMTDAAAEALRNVARHAGTSRVRIRLDNTNHRVTILIADDGCGFDVTMMGGGLTHSVVGRMAEIGGCARIDSSLGGTTVELIWADPTMDQRITTAVAHLRSALTPVVIPAIVGTIVMSLLVLPAIAKPGLFLCGLIVVSLLGAIAVRRATGNLGPIMLPVLMGGMVFGLVTNFWAVPATTGNGFHLVMAGGAMPLIAVIAIHYSLRWAWSSLIIGWLILLGLLLFRFGPELVVINLFGATTPPVIVLAVLLLRELLRRVARRALTAQDATLRSRIRIADSAMRRFGDDDRLRRTQARVLPFLAAIAEGRVDPGHPTTARRAMRLEAAVRQELRWESSTDEVLIASDRARERGWELELRLSEAQLARHTGELVAILTELGPASGAGPVVVSAFSGLSVVVQNPRPEHLEHWRSRKRFAVEEAEGWCRLTVRVPEKGDSRQPAGSDTLTV